MAEPRPAGRLLRETQAAAQGTIAARCIELLVKEVMSAVREHGKSLGLNDPWEATAPVHLRYWTDIPVQTAATE
jgi:hypothetical protein